MLTGWLALPQLAYQYRTKVRVCLMCLDGRCLAIEVRVSIMSGTCETVTSVALAKVDEGMFAFVLYVEPGRKPDRQH